MKLLNDFKNEGAARGLSVYEIPKAVAVVGRRWTVDNKTMTVSNKVNRHRIQLECDNHLRRIVGAAWASHGELREERSLLDRIVHFFCATSEIDAEGFLPEARTAEGSLRYFSQLGSLKSMDASLLLKLNEGLLEKPPFQAYYGSI